MRGRIALLVRAISLCVLFCPLLAKAEVTLQVPAGVQAAGVPPIPLSLVQRAEPYTRFKSSTLLDWHPKTSAALIFTATQSPGTEQLHLVAGSGATPELLVAQRDRVVEATFQPLHGNHVLVRTLAHDGKSSLSLLDLPSRKLSRISPADESAGTGVWNTSGESVVFTTSTTPSKLYTGDPRLPEQMKVVTSTDGVGTKLEIANHLNDFRTIGIDLVAMCVNDLIVQGAKPVVFLDYIAIPKVIEKKYKQILSGIAKGCRIAGCS